MLYPFAISAFSAVGRCTGWFFSILVGGTDLRYELKLVCNAHWLPQARSWIRLHPAGFMTTYPPRRVNSLYLDTPRLDCFSANLEGTGIRNKLRIRWYGQNITNIQPYLEIKHKSNQLGFKKRVPLPRRLDLTRPWRDILKTIYTHIDPYWQLVWATAHTPILINHYRREYYATQDGALRVTLDSEQTAYDQRFGLRPNLRAPLPIADTIVIEIKAQESESGRVQQAVSRFPIPRTRNSKYATGVLSALYSQ